MERTRTRPPSSIPAPPAPALEPLPLGGPFTWLVVELIRRRRARRLAAGVSAPAA